MSRPIGWKLPAGLFFLALIPLIPGFLRLSEMMGAPALLPVDAYSQSIKVPVAVHIVSAIVFYMLGALQFSPGIRRTRPAFHRWTGRLIVPFGLAVAGSALVITLGYPHREGEHELLPVFQALAGGGMLLSLLLGVYFILQRNIMAHRAWMIRAYALGLGAATQTITIAPFMIFAPPDALSRALLMGAGWAINLAIAEWIIRNTPKRQSRPIAA